MSEAVFGFEILTQSSILCDLHVEEAVICAYDGEVGVLPGHADLIGKLKKGVIRASLDNTNMFFVVSGGFYRVENSKLIVMAKEAYDAERLKEEEVTKELESLKVKLKSIENSKENGDLKLKKSLLEKISLNEEALKALELLHL